MSSLDTLLERMRVVGEAPAVAFGDRSCTFRELLHDAASWRRRLAADLPSGSVVSLVGDFVPASIAAMLALVAHRCVVVPRCEGGSLGAHAHEQHVARAQYEVARGGVTVTRLGGDGAAARDTHPLYRALHARGHAGLVVFTSGTSGEPKAILHDFDALLAKYETPRPALRTIAFLLFDHLGGLNTMLHTLSNGGLLVHVPDRSPDAICERIARTGAELLPATPSFLSLLLASGGHRAHDLSSLRVISYGAEPMPEATLRRLRAVFPGVELRQTYGLAEAGVLRVRCRPDGSRWMRLGGEGVETRVVAGRLQVRSPWQMLGYLNAESCVDAEGWLETHDVVERDGDYVRVLGRRTDAVKVAGEQVFPSEIEGVIESVPGVAMAQVVAEPNVIAGHLLVASVALVPGADGDAVLRAARERCERTLSRPMVPRRWLVATGGLQSERLKKQRRPVA